MSEPFLRISITVTSLNHENPNQKKMDLYKIHDTEPFFSRRIRVFESIMLHRVSFLLIAATVTRLFMLSAIW